MKKQENKRKKKKLKIQMLLRNQLQLIFFISKKEDLNSLKNTLKSPIRK
jgi:hypothetical protein